MLRIEIVDEDCTDSEAHIFRVPLETHWMDVHLAVKLFYPTATEVHFYTEEAVEG